MPDLQNAFMEFHDTIRLDDESPILRDKRDIILNKLKERITSEAASYIWFNQGSYAMHTGIYPDDGDYDIDVGLQFSIDKDDYPDPIKVKKWVSDALKNHTKSVKIRRSCVTVQYQENDEPIYHVDLAVFAGNNADGKLYIAKGKENSDASNKVWEISDPRGLIDKLNDKYTNADDRAQFKRVIRYLKKWRGVNFSSLGNSAPTGIALTILAYNMFVVEKKCDPVSLKTRYDDFIAFSNTVKKIKSAFALTFVPESNIYIHTISAYLPVEPGNDVLSKMTALQQEAFYKKIVNLSDKLFEVEREVILSEKCTLLQQIFGSDFPIKSAKSIIGSTESAL